LSPFENRDIQLGFNRGWRAGYRKATFDHLASLAGVDVPECAECGETSLEKLEIDHPNGIDKPRTSGRDYRDWRNIRECRILCRRCNKKIKPSSRRTPVV